MTRHVASDFWSRWTFCHLQPARTRATDLRSSDLVEEDLSGIKGKYADFLSV